MSTYQYIDPGPTPPATSPATAKVMRKTGRRDTQPELNLRRALHRRGLRFLVDVSPRGTNRRRRVDILLRGARIAVFVDGCFWRSCPVHAHLPKSNRDWWQRKLEGVVRRDRDSDAELTAAGWLVVRVWEHEDPEVAADRIAHLVQERRVHRRS
ncbi:DNA mismatch endonuclease Vsr [Saccharopolyspora shandongensis]|uniref:very short patch repair endonuclease n=1 Tax=Saccharopolyspora shandongensis TaxID=418495 RepID=UPI0033C0E4C3